MRSIIRAIENAILDMEEARFELATMGAVAFAIALVLVILFVSF